MASLSEKRKKIEELVYNVFDKLDKTGENTKKYREMFRSMDDKKFESWMNKFVNDPNQLFSMEILPFKNEPEFKDIEAAGKVLNMPFEEYVYFRDEVTGKTVRSAHKVPVFYVYVKRLQQIVAKKTAVSTSIKSRNAITNQISGDDKVARNSDVESYALLTEGNVNTLKEIMGPRAGNIGQKRAMYNMISRDGFVKLSDIQANDSVFEKPELNAFDVYLLGMGLKSDLVTDGLKLAGSFKSGMD